MTELFGVSKAYLYVSFVILLCACSGEGTMPDLEFGANGCPDLTNWRYVEQGTPPEKQDNQIVFQTGDIAFIARAVFFFGGGWFEYTCENGEFSLSIYGDIYSIWSDDYYQSINFALSDDRETPTIFALHTSL